MKFSIVAAADSKMGIGIGNRLPWKLAGDLKFFSKVTTETTPGKMNAVIMGRKTWESLPEKHRPLKDRINVVLSRSEIKLPEGVQHASSIDDALRALEGRTDVDRVFVIGGANVYAQAIAHPDADKIYLTEVEGEFNCDAFFPPIPEESFGKKSVSETHNENGVNYRFAEYVRK